MTENVHQLFPAGEGGSSETPAPALPIEQHIVSAALAAERLRGLTEQMLMVLRYASRDQAMFDRLHNELLDAWSDISDHYSTYRHVLDCKGQA